MHAEKLIKWLSSNDIINCDGPLTPELAQQAAEEWPEAWPRSICAKNGRVYALCGRGAEKSLRIIASGHDASDLAAETGFEPDDVFTISVTGELFMIVTCAINAANAAALRREFPFTVPVPIGTKPAIGVGDRIGIATPGHIRAIRDYDIIPILPQQSIREMQRTGRSPQNVIDDVSWAVFQEGYCKPFGADADHLKTEDDIRYTSAAGFTMYTIDPSEHIRNDADDIGDGELAAEFDKLFKGNPAERDALIEKFADKPFELIDDISGFRYTFFLKSRGVMRIAVKYLPAVRHTIKLHGLLKELRGSAFDLEMSVDETETPTPPEAHLFVAELLRSNGVKVHSIAPRFVGEFQKGIDYIGDVAYFTETAQLHALIARAMGPYKLSIHSGSDKFSIFPIVGRLTHGLFHEKTAGTSYLEAVRVVSRRAPALYREMHAYALERFEIDRASYHVTTNLAAIPPLDSLSDAELPALMDEIDSRQLMHITYGSVLTEKNADGTPRFHDRLLAVLNEHEEEHYDTLAGHIRHHLESLGVSKA